MNNPYSQSLYEATLAGNSYEVETIQEKIEKRAAATSSERKETIVNFNTVLNDDESSAKSIYNFLNKSFGNDWWEWEFETLERVLWIKFGVALEDINRDKIFAIRHLCRSDRAFWDWIEFNHLALSFSGSIADFEMIRRPSPGMIINAVKTMNIIRPERESNFGNETVKYICVLLIDDGIYCPPPSLFLIIEKSFSEMISEEMKNKWNEIYKKYKALISQQDNKVEENEIDIQAKRLVIAESSALSYWS